MMTKFEQPASRRSSTRLTRTRTLITAFLFALLVAPQAAMAAEPMRTKVVFLGVGFPRPDPQAMGPSLAILVGDRAYLVDAGAGLVRRAAEAFARGNPSLSVDNLDTVFITHLHSDHTLGLPDLLLTPWVVGRTKPLTVVGPPGSKRMLESIAQAWTQDIDVRINGEEGGNKTGYKSAVSEIVPGLVYQDERIKVTAFKVNHGSWHDAYGFRFDTADRSIVVSGDTTSLPDVMKEQCNGCDLLVHEVFAGEGIIENTFTAKKLGHSTANWAAYMSKFHTSARDLGSIAEAAAPKLLVLHHAIPLGAVTDQEMINQVKQKFSGRVEMARDLAEY